MKTLKINRKLFEAILKKLPERYEDLKEGTPEDLLDSIVIDISNPSRTIGIRIEAESDRVETELVEKEEEGITLEDLFSSFVGHDIEECVDCDFNNQESDYKPKKAGIIAFLKNLKPELTGEQLDERAEVLLTIIESTK